MSDFKKHTLRLKGYETENGKIPFSLLKGLGEQLTRLAESTLLSYVEGNSKVKRGKAPDWLKKSIDFTLTGIREGSTVLDIEAPLLSESIGHVQIPIFQDFEVEKLKETSALDLSFFVYKQALGNQGESNLLDKNLLKEITKLNKILESDDTEIIFTSDKENFAITKNTLSEIKILEEKTPQSIKAKITGKLDVLLHSKSQLEILTEGKKIRAKLSEQVKFDDVFPLFGEDVSISGITNFNPAGKITSFEITAIKKAEIEDDYFRTIPKPIFKEFDLKRIAKENDYRGSNLENIIGKWPGDETTDELLEMLK